MKNESCLRKILERFKNDEITKEEALNGIDAVFSTNDKFSTIDRDYSDYSGIYSEDKTSYINKSIFDRFFL